MANLKVSSGISSKTYGDNIFPLVGTILPYAGSTAPDGWLLCDGATFSSSTYPELYSLIGSTTLPDLREKYLRGASSSNVTKESVGSVGHTHNASYSASNSSNNNSADATHAHTMNYLGVQESNAAHNHVGTFIGAAAYGYMTNAGNFVAGNQANMVGTHYHYGSYAANLYDPGYHTHTINATSNNNTNPSHSHVFSSSSSSAVIGSNTAETIVPPTMYLNYIVKAG